jgi:hypothetical protein
MAISQGSKRVRLCPVCNTLVERGQPYESSSHKTWHKKCKESTRL